MLEVIKDINTNYASILSCISSLIMVVVTIIYVSHTKRQANYAKESAELVAQQIRIDKQPCIVPHITESYGTAFNATEYTRIQLGFGIDLENIGDAPAINVFTIAEIELQFTQDAHGNKKRLSASLLPDYVSAIAANQRENTSLHFETKEVHTLVSELQIAMNKNQERIVRTPTHPAYWGAQICIRIFYRNAVGQWSESSLSREIAWLRYKNPPENKTRNINENTIPPRDIKEGDIFEAVLISPKYAPFQYKMVTESYVNDTLSLYHKDSSIWETAFKKNA